MLGRIGHPIIPNMMTEKEKNMGKNIFDYEDGTFAHSISNNMAINSDGDLLMRMGNNMAMNMDTGDLHFVTNWSDDNEDND